MVLLCTMLSIAGACVLVGSAASSPYSGLNPPADMILDLQMRANNGYYCDASINYDLLPSVRNMVLFFAGMKVCANKKETRWNDA